MAALPTGVLWNKSILKLLVGLVAGPPHFWILGAMAWWPPDYLLVVLVVTTLGPVLGVDVVRNDSFANDTVRCRRFMDHMRHSCAVA